MSEIGFWNTDTEWLNYGLTENYIKLNGEDTGYKAILRDEEMVAIVRKGYRLWPNEEALKLADKAAKLVGLEQFQVSMPGARGEDHILYDERRHKMKAIYVLTNEVDIKGDGVNVGVSVHNSIDGTSSFGCGLFTFRSICSNGVIFGRKDITAVRHRHTKGLETVLEQMQNTMTYMMEQALDIVESYRQMARRKVTASLIEKIRKSRFIPKKVLPEYLQLDEAQETLVELTEWEMYNDITELIWHNDRTGMVTKDLQFNALHKIMPLIARRF